MKYRYFRNNPRAYDKLSPRAEREKDSSPFFLSFSVQQFDKATSVSASKGIERDYWTVDWITGLLSRISFLPSFECKARRINFRVGRRFYSYEKLPEGGGKKRKGRGGKTCAVVEHPCSSFVLHPFLSHGISSKRGERERENSSPVKKSIYIYTTHLLASICKSNLLSFNHRLLDGSGSVKGWARAAPFLRSIGLNLFLLAAPR